jgi:hypothetical protein
MEVMRENIVNCVHRSIQDKPSSGEHITGKEYAAPYSPLSRVQLFQRLLAGGRPPQNEEFAAPHLQQSARAVSGRFRQTGENENVNK